MQKNKLKYLSGFTLIELLIVIVIIGILATMATIALNSARQKTRDTKRISDIKQIQTALDMYFNDNESYPSAEGNGSGCTTDELCFGKAFSSNGIIYLTKVPNNPSPRNDGSCTNSDYSYTSNGLTYTISYCLGGIINTIGPGGCQATPGQICKSIPACACDDITIACCNNCAIGSQCGGGILFNNNFNGHQLISYNFSNLERRWKNSPPYSILIGATSNTDGYSNTNLLNDSDYGAARYCLDKNDNGFTDWYLPAREELCNLLRNSNLCNVVTWPCGSNCDNGQILNGASRATQYWSSTEIDMANAYSFHIRTDYTGNYVQNVKSSDNIDVWCIRRQ